MNMNSRILIAPLSALLCSCALLMASSAFAQQAESDKVKAAVESLHAGLSSKDMKKIDEIWAHDGYVTAVQPRDKTITVGWDGVRKGFENAVGAWSEFKVSQQDGPHIHIQGSVAWSEGIATVSGKIKNGDTVVNAPTFETDIFEKRGDRWLLVSHIASRLPQ
jgi:ketosteroid isomerase-like protein